MTPVRLAVPTSAKKAIFAGGCFWGVEETFRTIPGVVDTQAGYTGGTLANPTYEAMHRDRTGHVEAVEVTYDPTKVTFEELLTVFFAKHDATRPSPDDATLGKQYRSFVFYHDDIEAKTARQVIQTLTDSKHYKGAPRPIVTQIQPAGVFWPAEEYHQRYYEKRSMPSSCRL